MIDKKTTPVPTGTPSAALPATNCCRSFAFNFDNLCCSQPARCNLQLHYARPVAAKAIEAFSFLLSYFNFHLSTFIFHLSTLTAPSNRNPQGVTLPRYLRLIAAGAVEASLSPFSFLLSPLSFDNLCCSQPTRCNLQLHYARPIAAKLVDNKTKEALTRFAGIVEV